jgi:hypothetical protein
MKRQRLGVGSIAAALAVGVLTAAAAAPALAGPGAVGKSGTALAPDEIGHSANITHLSNTPHSGPLTAIGTDMAFQDGKAFVGNYNGFVIYDVANAAAPKVVSQVSCPGSQNDISVYGNLLFLSTDSSRSNDSCASTEQPATVKTSWEGIKIFDISVPANPRYIKSVETACGSHTHTILPSKNKLNVYVYVSSFSPDATFPDCQPPHDSITIIDVPVQAPTSAHIASIPNLFPDGGDAGAPGRSATTGCHDITVYPLKNIAAGACMGDGVILDITDPVHPTVIDRVTDDVNFAFWHSATFNQNATKVVFTDELGGGVTATCNAQVGPNRGADGIYDLGLDRKLTFRSYFKIPRHQTDTENCVAHNGSLIPVKGRDLMVQSWYMGGVSFWDFTDSANPRELGFFERGPAVPSAGAGGTWSAYYYNGHVFSSDIGKGFDTLAITDPIVASAALVKMGTLNVQSQPSYTAFSRVRH